LTGRAWSEGVAFLQDLDPTDAVRRRMAVGKGLRCLPLDEDQVFRAMALWDHLFDQGRGQAIAHYVDTVAALLKLSDPERHAARLAILREMISASLDLRPPAPQAIQRQPMVS
jgi:hypothetical protein